MPFLDPGPGHFHVILDESSTFSTPEPPGRGPEMAPVLDLLSGLLCFTAETCVIFRGSFWTPFFDAFVDACVIFRGFILDPLF